MASAADLRDTCFRVAGKTEGCFPSCPQTLNSAIEAMPFGSTPLSAFLGKRKQACSSTDPPPDTRLARAFRGTSLDHPYERSVLWEVRLTV